MVQQETMENLGEGFPGFDLYEKRLEEENGVRVDLVTQSFLEASELGDADSLRRKLNGLNVDQRRELVHAVDQQGASGLLLAVKGGKKEVAKVLLDFGANPNDADSSGATAGHYASMRGDPGLLKLLLDARCDAGRVDDRQDGLLAWAKGLRWFSSCWMLKPTRHSEVLGAKQP